MRIANASGRRAVSDDDGDRLIAAGRGVMGRGRIPGFAIRRNGAISWQDWVEICGKKQLLAGKDARPVFAERLLPPELAADELAGASVARESHGRRSE